MALERTSFGSPITGVRVPRVNAQTNSTLSTISQMASLGAGISTMVADQMEVNSQMDAQNDLINDSINPDKMLHQSAYAVTVAEGEALNGWNTEKEAVQNGVYKELDPEDYQQLVKDRHKEYAKKWEDNPNANMAVGAYNNFMLKNQPSIIAAQAGTWRLDQGEKQATALKDVVSEMAKNPLTTKEEYIAVITDPNYTLVDPKQRKQMALLGATEAGTITGNSEVLTALNEEFDYASDPELSGLYGVALKTVDRASRTMDDQQVLNMVDSVEKAKDQGILSIPMYEMVRDKVDANGNLLYTPKQWRTLVDQSRVIGINLDVKRNYKDQILHGIDVGDSKLSDFEDTLNEITQEALAQPNATSATVSETVGRLLVEQTHIYKPMQDRAHMFASVEMITDNEVNAESMQMFDELSGLQAGMSEFADGDKKFFKYLGSESMAKFLTVQNALKMSDSKNREDAFREVGQRMIRSEKVAATAKLQASVSKEGAQVGVEGATQIYEANKDYAWVPGMFDFIMDPIRAWTSPDDVHGNTALPIGLEYDRLRAMNYGHEESKDTAIRSANSNTTLINGKIQSISMQELQAATGVRDPEAAMQNLINNHAIKEQLIQSFGQTGSAFWRTEVPVSKYKLVDLPFGIDNKWILPFMTPIARAIHGDKTSYTPEEQRQLEEYKEGLEKHVDLDDTNMIINKHEGTVEFWGDNPEEPIFVIPLYAVGAFHTAMEQGIGDISVIDELYGGRFSQTDAGRKWQNEQVDLNNIYLNDIVRTNIGRERNAPSVDAYLKMSEKEQTISRKTWHASNYKGAAGQVGKFLDMFARKDELNTKEYKVTIGEDGELTYNYPDPIIQNLADMPLVKPTGTVNEFDHDFTVTIGEGVALRTNNPGNLESSELAGDEKIDGFAVFDTPEQGYSGLKRQIKLDADRGDTIRTFLEVFAPKEDGNDTEKYIRDLSEALGVTEGTKLNTLDNDAVAKAVAKLESGTTFK